MANSHPPAHSHLKPESVPAPLGKRARDALLDYIKGGNALHGPGSRLKLAYLIDPFDRRITEVFLKVPYRSHMCALILHREINLEAHRVAWGMQNLFVFVDENPALSKVPNDPSAMFCYRRTLHRRSSGRTGQGSSDQVWHMVGRGILSSTQISGYTGHCTAPHSWILDTFEFWDPSTREFRPASQFQSKITGADQL